MNFTVRSFCISFLLHSGYGKIFYWRYEAFKIATFFFILFFHFLVKHPSSPSNRCPFKEPVCQISRMCLGYYFQWLWIIFFFVHVTTWCYKYEGKLAMAPLFILFELKSLYGSVIVCIEEIQMFCINTLLSFLFTQT